MEAEFTYAALPTTGRGQQTLLSSSANGEWLAYCSGRAVILRSLKSFALTRAYGEHASPVTAARFSPSGFYVASGDTAGNVRVWDCVGQDFILKTATRPLSSRVNDISWDAESKRIAVGGDGKERFAHVFAFDTAASLGEVLGHSKPVNSISFRPSRPFKLVSGGDDCQVNFYQGPPFKFVKSSSHHSRFVQVVRYLEDGSNFLSAGSDGKVFMYDGNQGDMLDDLNVGHTGSIFGMSLRAKRIATSSADMTVKLFDLEKKSTVCSWTIGSSIDDQQVGNTWAQENLIVSVSLSGTLSFLDPRSPSTVHSILGHQKAITALTTTSTGQLLTGSYDGKTYMWSDDKQKTMKDGVQMSNAFGIAGQGHSNQVSAMGLDGDSIYTVGMDDTLKRIDLGASSFTDVSVPTQAVPKGVVTKNGLVFVSTINQHVLTVKDGKVVAKTPVDYQPGPLALSKDGSQLAVGSEDGRIFIYKVSEGTLPAPSSVLSYNRGAITCLEYSDNVTLAIGDAERKVFIVKLASVATQSHESHPPEFDAPCHTSRVTSVSFSPSGKYLVTGGLDRSVYVWNVATASRPHAVTRNAHIESVNAVKVLSEGENGRVATVGQDACVRVWKVAMP